jgi:hypothetical protein
MYRWGRKVNNIHLVIRYLRDEVTREYVTEGVFWDVSQLMGQRWLIQNDRKFILDLVRTAAGDIQVKDGDLAATGRGPGEAIDEDVSTPEKMAVYLEKLANNS